MHRMAEPQSLMYLQNPSMRMGMTILMNRSTQRQMERLQKENPQMSSLEAYNQAMLNQSLKRVKE
jgi:hypothetical protein